MNDNTARALVTGGSGGIGGAICRALSAQGHYVYVHAHRGVAHAAGLTQLLIPGSAEEWAQPLRRLLA